MFYELFVKAKIFSHAQFSVRGWCSELWGQGFLIVQHPSSWSTPCHDQIRCLTFDYNTHSICLTCSKCLHFIYIPGTSVEHSEGSQTAKLWWPGRKNLFFSLDSLITTCMDFKQFRFLKTRRPVPVSVLPPWLWLTVVMRPVNIF